jgi:taurine dioxygenase
LKETVSAVPLSESVGVEIKGINLPESLKDPSLRLFIREELAQHRCVLLRNQNIEPDQVNEFMSGFGPLYGFVMKWDEKGDPRKAPHIPGNPYIKVMSNMVQPNGVPYGDGNTLPQIWHSDGTLFEVPTSVIGMYCRVAPNPPPKTSFLDMCAAYADLPEATKEEIKELRVIHHFYDRQVYVSVAAKGESRPLEERLNGRVHPLVRRHIPTSLPILFLPTRRDSIVQGWGEAESRELLERLWDHVNSSPHFVSIGLEPDDLVLWDNAATVHCREGWPEDQGRMVWHFAAQGEVPTPMFGVSEANPFGRVPVVG